MKQLIISAQKALFQSITKNTKAVYAKIEHDTLFWHVYFDEAPTDDEMELLSIAATEILADFPNVLHCDERYITHPGPLHFESYEHWIYARI